MMTVFAQGDPKTQRLGRLMSIIGAAAAVVSLAGIFLDPTQFYRSYLFAYVFWLAIPLGSLAILMLHFLVGGMWGWMIRRLLEAATRTLPLMALFFVPILFGLHALYPWADPHHLTGDRALEHKAAYLNVFFYSARAIVYLGLWAGIACLLNRWSREQDATAELPAGKRMRRLSGPGLVIYFLTMTFASIDWIMSIEPHWYSTIYGAIWVVNQGLSALAFAIIGLTVIESRSPVAGRVEQGHFHDLGNLLLAFVMLWAYMMFSQYLIIWSGNLAEEIPWYLVRNRGVWRWFPPVLILFHFFVPFVLLLVRDVKRKSGFLIWVAAGVLVMRVLDTHWMIMPGFAHEGSVAAPHWLDLTLLAALGGIWSGVFLWQLERMPLLPVHTPVAAEETAAHA
jgi:hypothetical protein